MAIKFQSRFGVDLGNVIKDKRRRTWVVVGLHYEMGGNCQIVRLVRANPGICFFVKTLADEKFDEFQFDHIP